MKTALRISVIVIMTVAGAAWMLLSVDAQKKSRDKFFHDTAAHKKLNCSSCHQNPTGNWEAARGFPDVADYPGHASCIGCHRADFFSGNRPAICTICHTNPSPSNGKRFPFPVPTRSSEFTTIFPHDVHQDIIAMNDGEKSDIEALAVHVAPPTRRLFGGRPALHTEASRFRDSQRVAGGTFVPAHFVPTALLTEDPPPTFNNCAICHETTAALPKFGNRPVRGQALGTAPAENFTPGVGFFKTSPEGHASCFSCHYQGQKPIRTDCAGCHGPASPYVDSSVISRYSLKFDHQSPNHVNKDCTTCHVRITQTADLAAMKDADVPFMTCASCHAAQLKEETDKRAATVAGKLPIFQCIYCHSPEIGRFEIPASHKNR